MQTSSLKWEGMECPSLGGIDFGMQGAEGAAVDFVSGVFIAAVGNIVFDLIYDHREAIYETITDTVGSIGDTLSDVGDSIINTR